jgi:hypothetical protein
MAPMAWIGFDIDGTIAYDKGGAWGKPGPPIPEMVALVRAYRAQGHDVRLFTARISCTPDLLEEVVRDLEAWSLEHLGEVLPITCQKDLSMWLLYDDRVVQVEKNTGRILEDVIQTAQRTLAEADKTAEGALAALARLEGVLGPPVERRSVPRDQFGEPLASPVARGDES